MFMYLYPNNQGGGQNQGNQPNKQNQPNQGQGFDKQGQGKDMGGKQGYNSDNQTGQNPGTKNLGDQQNIKGQKQNTDDVTRR